MAEGGCIVKLYMNIELVVAIVAGVVRGRRGAEMRMM